MVTLPWGEVVPAWLGLSFWAFVGYDAVALLVLAWLAFTEWIYRR